MVIIYVNAYVECMMHHMFIIYVTYMMHILKIHMLHIWLCTPYMKHVYAIEIHASIVCKVVQVRYHQIP